MIVATGHAGSENARERGGRNPHIPALSPLDWDALAQLREAGAALGAPTRTHRQLNQLSATAVDEELAGAAEESERRLGDRPTGIAYLCGAADRRVVRQSTRYYRWACTTEFQGLHERDHAPRPRRIDAWYLRNPATLDAWGILGFQAWTWRHRLARRARGH